MPKDSPAGRRGPSVALRHRRGLVVLVDLFESLDLRFGLVLGEAVGLLNAARQLVSLAGNGVEIVVGQLAPLLPSLAL
jgi:hypothetical protein